MPLHHGLHRGLQHSCRRARPRARARAAPYRRPAPAHRRAHGTAGPPAAATAAGCPRSPGSALQPLDLALRQCDERQIARRAAAGMPAPAPHCRTSAVKRAEPALAPDRAPAPHRAARGAKLQFAVSRGPSAPSRVSALISIRCASGIAGSPPPARIPASSGAIGQAGGPQSGAQRPGREPAQIVEAELRRRQARQAPAPSRRSDSAAARSPAPCRGTARNCSLMLFSARPSAAPARQRLLQIERARIKPHRIEAGEPAHRPGQVHAREADPPRGHDLRGPAAPHGRRTLTGDLAPDPAPRRQSATASASPVSSTSLMPPWNAAGTRVSSASVTEAGSVSVRCPAVPCVPRRIQPLRRQRKRRLAQHPAPERKLLRNRCVPRLRRKPLRPAPERRPPRQAARPPGPPPTARHAAARSGPRIRHDTPSTAR